MAERLATKTEDHGCVLGTLLSTERETERSFHELHVRSETGLGAERAVARS
jgi:cation/acetate symporter